MAIALIDKSKEEACRLAEANAIRVKTGENASITYDFANNKGFADAIAAIQTGECVQTASGTFNGCPAAVNCGFAPDIVLVTSTSEPIDLYTESGDPYSVCWIFDFRVYTHALTIAYWGVYPGRFGMIYMYGDKTNNGFNVTSVANARASEALPQISLPSAEYSYLAVKFL